VDLPPDIAEIAKQFFQPYHDDGSWYRVYRRGLELLEEHGSGTAHYPLIVEAVRRALAGIMVGLDERQGLKHFGNGAVKSATFRADYARFEALAAELPRPTPLDAYLEELQAAYAATPSKAKPKAKPAFGVTPPAQKKRPSPAKKSRAPTTKRR
jgi:hypothetical protein